MYAKLFRSLLLSSVWSEDPATKVLWVSMLAEADAEGYVFGSIVGLAKMAGLLVDETQSSLAKLMAPDPVSSDLTRAPENEGRRVVVIPGGWRLVNYAYYRDLQDVDVRRAQDRLRKQRYRSQTKRPRVSRRVPRCPTLSRDVPPIPKCPPSDADADAANGGTTSLSGQVEPAPARRKPLRQTSADPDLHRRAETFVRYFREQYLAHADPKYRFSEHLPAADLDSAKYLLRRWDSDRLAAIIAWTVRDRGDARFSGWAKNVKCVAKLKDKIADLDQKERDSKHEPDDRSDFMGPDIDEESNDA